MKNKNIAYLVIVIVLIVIVIVAVALMHALPKNTPQTEYGTTTPTATTTASQTGEEGYSTYDNSKYGFSIMYPTSLSKTDPAMSEGYDDDLDTSDIFTTEIPKDTFKGTNLYEVHIIAGAKATDQNTCAYMINGNDARDMEPKQQPTETTINGIDFTKIRVSDAGAGNFYDTIRYSTYRAGTCYELLAVAHSANIGILQETDPTVKQYTDDMFVPEFDEIASSFHFLAS